MTEQPDTHTPANPARLAAYDPEWPAIAGRWLADIRVSLHGLVGADAAEYAHIGSSAVLGLVAKPIIDLQVRILPLPAEADLGVRLGRIGLVRARGSRPDSPGVDRDIPRGDERADANVWEKRLFVDDAGSTILHVRRSDSPWGRYTVWFRDWLRADDRARERYAALKRELSNRNVGKADYDDYTRAKTAFFDEVQDAFVRWASERADPTRAKKDRSS